MSQLDQVKQALSAVSADAKSTAGSLAAFESKFSSAIANITAAIGNSSQNADKAMIASLNDAEKQVKAAVAALTGVASNAEQFASGL